MKEKQGEPVVVVVGGVTKGFLSNGFCLHRKQGPGHHLEGKWGRLRRDPEALPCAGWRFVISLVQVKPVRLAGWFPPAGPAGGRRQMAGPWPGEYFGG